MTDPDTGTLYQADPFHTTPPVALPPAEPSALEKLDAEIAATVTDLGLAKEKALAHDPDVQRFTGRLADLKRARQQYVDAEATLAKLLSGDPKPAKRGRRSRHAAVDSER